MTSVHDLTNVLLDEWSNLRSHALKFTEKPSQKSGGYYNNGETKFKMECSDKHMWVCCLGIGISLNNFETLKQIRNDFMHCEFM